MGLTPLGGSDISSYKHSSHSGSELCCRIFPSQSPNNTARSWDIPHSGATTSQTPCRDFSLSEAQLHSWNFSHSEASLQVLSWDKPHSGTTRQDIPNVSKSKQFSEQISSNETITKQTRQNPNNAPFQSYRFYYKVFRLHPSNYKLGNI